MTNASDPTSKRPGSAPTLQRLWSWVSGVPAISDIEMLPNQLRIRRGFWRLKSHEPTKWTCSLKNSSSMYGNFSTDRGGQSAPR